MFPMTTFTDDSWARFLTNTEGRPPREMLMRALEYEPAVKDALDLACGPGNEVLVLLERGCAVTAIDSYPPALKRTQQRAEQAGVATRLTTVEARLETLELQSSAFDLVHAGFSLPFCPPAHFERLWQAIRNSLRNGGLFAGQLFGPDDEWATRPDMKGMSFHDRQTVEAMFDGFDPLHVQEENRPGKTASGEAKHWHVFHLILRRTASNQA